MHAVFDHAEDITGSIRTFWFKPERPLQYTAGQFTELTLLHPHADKRGERRWFTLSSSPHEPLVSITTRRAEEHGSSFKRALWSLQPGDTVEMAEAMGDFVLPKFVQTPLVFVAGGIGITPFHSMLSWLAQSGESRPVRLLWSVRTEDDICFQDIFQAANIDPTIVVSEPTAVWGGERGRLNAEMILGLEPPTGDTLFYLSGPEPMLEALQADLLRQGLSRRQIVTDFFPGYPSL